MVGRCVRERIVETTAIPVRGVRKSVDIFFNINRFEEESFVPSRLGVFDQNSGGAIDAPHLKSGPKKSAYTMDVVEFRPNATYLEGRVQVVFQYGRQEQPAGMPAPAVGLNDSLLLFLAKGKEF